MKEDSKCAQCGQPLSADAPQGLCPACLLKLAAKGPTDALDSSALREADPSLDVPTDAPGVRNAEDLKKLFPQLEILGQLGAGGMGAVYKARQKQLDRLVALKLMHPRFSRDPQFAERFNREARALAKLNHPNIVSVYDFGTAGGAGLEQFYFIMEYVDGANVQQMIGTKAFSPNEALTIVPKLCDALQYAHDEGVVHRDIKPANILVDKKGRVKIADFGLAKIAGVDDARLTRTNQGMGTMMYMAPEQVENAKDVDHRADIYSLGVVFYEMLTGELPMGRFAPPSEKVQVDVRFDEIVLHALERDVARRYQHVSEVKTAVEKVTSTPAREAVSVDKPISPREGKPWPAWVWWTLLVLIPLPFFQIAELNRVEELAGHGPKYGGAGLLTLMLVALGGFAVIKLLELREAKAGATPNAPFSHTWLGIIVALLGVCVIFTGPFPYVEWLHETLKVPPVKVVNDDGLTVELAGFSQTLVKHGYEFWQGQATALVSVLMGAFLLLAPRRLRWNMAASFLLLIAGAAIIVLMGSFEFESRGQSYTADTESMAKSNPVYRHFYDDFKRHKETEAANKHVSAEALEKLGYAYGGAFGNRGAAYGHAWCLTVAFVLIIIGVLKLRQTMRTSSASFAGWSRLVETWGSLVLLVPCLISVLPFFGFSWGQNMAWIPLFKNVAWFGDWVKESRLSLAGVGFWQGRVIAAFCIVAIVLVIATALLKWKRVLRAAALSLAGIAAIACTILYFSRPREEATLSWQDFKAVAQRGATAAESAETHRFLAAHPSYVGQIVELDTNLQALITKLNAPDPVAVPKVTVTKNADGTTTTTTETPVIFPDQATRRPLAKILEKGGGEVSLYTYSQNGAQWPVILGLGLLLMGIRDGLRAWRNRVASVSN